MNADVFARIGTNRRALWLIGLIVISAFQDASAQSCKVVDDRINESWIGSCVNGLANGSGTASGRANAQGKSNTYTGELKDGKKIGQGKFQWADGEVFEGQWLDDRAYFGTYHGRGDHFTITYQQSMLNMRTAHPGYFRGRVEVGPPLGLPGFVAICETLEECPKETIVTADRPRLSDYDSRLLGDLQIDVRTFLKLNTTMQDNLLTGMKLSFQPDPTAYYSLAQMVKANSRGNAVLMNALAPVLAESNTLVAMMRQSPSQAMFFSSVADSQRSIANETQMVLRGAPGAGQVFTELGRMGASPLGQEILKVRELWVAFGGTAGDLADQKQPGGREAEVIFHAHDPQQARKWVDSGDSWNQLIVKQVEGQALAATARVGTVMDRLFPGAPPAQSTCMTHVEMVSRQDSEGYDHPSYVNVDCHGERAY